MGVDKDDAKAVQLFERSARLGSSHGLNSLGNCHFQGRGVPQNYEQAFVLYERASQNRNMNKAALYNLGCCFYSGKGTSQDLSEAFLQFQKAADLGLDIAQYVVMFLHFIFVTIGAGTVSASACATASAANPMLRSPWIGSACSNPEARKN